MIMLIGPSSEAQEGRISGPAARPGSEAEPGQRARGTPFGTGMLPSPEILSAQFQATVYEVQAAAERLGSLDDKVLTRQAATPETLLAALAQTGKPRLLYRIEQPVNVFSTRIIIGSSEPVITGTRTTATGGTVNSISYQTLGFIVGLSAQAPPKDQNTAAPIVTTAIKLSVLSPGEKEIAPGQKESVIRMMSLDHSAALELNATASGAGHQFECLQQLPKVGGGESKGRIAGHACRVCHSVSVWPPRPKQCRRGLTKSG